MGIQHKITEYFEFKPSEIIKTNDFIENLRKMIGFSLNDVTDKKKVNEAYDKTNKKKQRDYIKKIIGGKKKLEIPKNKEKKNQSKKRIQNLETKKINANKAKIRYHNNKNNIEFQKKILERKKKYRLLHINDTFTCQACKITIPWLKKYEHCNTRHHYNNLDPNSEEAKKLNIKLTKINERSKLNYKKKLLS